MHNSKRLLANLVYFIQIKQQLKMNPQKTNLWIISFVFLFLLASCGRKQKNFIIFKNEESTKINKLDLPAVKGVSVQKLKTGFYISWLPFFPRIQSLGVF